MNLKMLDLIIGVIFFFTFASLICSTVLELIQSVLGSRAKMLEKALREILDDETPGRGEARKAAEEVALEPESAPSEKTKSVLVRFYEHPLIDSLFRGDYKSAVFDSSRVDKIKSGLVVRLGNRNLPSYIPPELFASALLDVVADSVINLPAIDTALPLEERQKKKLSDLRSALRNGSLLKGDAKTTRLIPNERLKTAILWALDNANDLEQAKKNLANWYDSSMERVTGWYKRDTQAWLLVIGAAVAFGLNMNAMEVVKKLYDDDGMRTAVIRSAENLTQSATVARDDGAHDRAVVVLPVTLAQPQKLDAANGLKQATAPQSPGTNQAHASSTPVEEKQPKNQAGEAEPILKQLNAAKIQISQLKNVLDLAGYQIGWTADTWNEFIGIISKETRNEAEFITLFSNFAGWLLTAIAMTLGASFWFDLLNKLVSLRSSLKPVSPEDAAKPKK